MVTRGLFQATLQQMALLLEPFLPTQKAPAKLSAAMSTPPTGSSVRKACAATHKCTKFLYIRGKDDKLRVHYQDHLYGKWNSCEVSTDARE